MTIQNEDNHAFLHVVNVNVNVNGQHFFEKIMNWFLITFYMALNFFF